MFIRRSAFILAGFLIILGTLQSATIYVPDDYTTIQEAIDASAHGDTVVVRPGTYDEQLVFNGKAITVKSELGAKVTAIDGNMTGSVVKFKDGEGPDSVLEGFTVRNGIGSKIYLNWRCGGGILCRAASSPTIRDNLITGNHANLAGGIYCGDGSCPTITENTISQNSVDKEGAGIFAQNGSDPVISYNIIKENTAELWGGGVEYYNNCSPTITDNIIIDNTVTQYGGGGIALGTNCSGTIMNNTISGNSIGRHGAAIFCEVDCSPTITRNNISGNTAAKEGGALLIRYSSSPRIEDNIISNNRAELFGGGIECWSECSTTIINNIITYNTVDQYDGGGIVMSKDCTGTIANNLIVGNSTGRYGGGVHCEVNSSISLANNTIYGNTAKSGGGAISCVSGSSVVVTDTILWSNAPAGSEVWIGDAAVHSILTISHSDIDGGQTSVHVEPGCTLNWGAGMIDEDPLFVQGPFGFKYLCQTAAGQATDSPCVDSGSDLASNLGMDTYFTRTDEVPDSGVVDMGYHYGPFMCPCLQADLCFIPEKTGGTVHYLLQAGPENGLRNYLLVGGVSGTENGMPLPGGYSTLPIEWDWFSDFVMSFLNTPVFWDFMGKLDAQGTAVAQLNLPPVPGAAGVTMYYAYCCNNPFDFVSNPVSVGILP